MKSIIDINSDMGELKHLLDDSTYAEMMQYITSINVACGGHAGDDDMMLAMVMMAKEWGINIGAHPSYPDKENFGRIKIDMTSAAISETIAEQITRLNEIASNNSSLLTHVKPHGALYNKAVNDEEIAAAIGTGVKYVDEELKLVGLAGSKMLAVWQGMGFDIMGEGFADRTYECNGTLRSRKFDDALITDPGIAAEQAECMARNENFTAVDGTALNITVQTICVHSDTPNAVEIAHAVHTALQP